MILALGAGVSYGCGIPTWKDLLKRLAEGARTKNGASLFEQFEADGYTLPAIAGVLEAMYPDKKFSLAIKKQLYREFAFAKGIDDRNRDKFVEFVKDKNPTLASVASFCALKDGEHSFIPNTRVHAIINTNYDQTLQAYMHARYKLKHKNRHGRKRITRTIERPSAGSKFGSIPVYYMHGYIRFDKHIEDYKKGAADLRVLTEQDFFDFFNNPSGLFNYTALYLWREYPCLFIGMSLKDDNIRRLLHYSRKERLTSYLREGVAARVAERKSIRHFAFIKYPTQVVVGKKNTVQLDKLAEATRIALRRLGVKVLWVNDYAEIGRRLRDLYQSTKPPLTWKEVY